MKLDEKEILSMAEKVKNGEATKEELKELLGGDRLDDLFAFDNTVDIMLSYIIYIGKVHDLLEGNGFDILEGLLNKKIVGDLSAFYCIKPEYIISLPKEEQEKMATAIAKDWKELHDMLVFLWSKGIMTEASTTSLEDNYPMVQMKVSIDDIEAQELIQQIYEHDGIDVDRISYYSEIFTVNLKGDNLYSYCKEDIIKRNRIAKDDIFEKELESSIKFIEEITERMNDLMPSQENANGTGEVVEVERKKLLKLREAKSKKRKSWELTSDQKAQIEEKSIDIAKNIGDSATHAKNSNEQKETTGQEY